MALAADPRLRSWIQLWAWIMAGCCAAMAVVVLVSLWVLSGFRGLGVDAVTTVALLGGSIAATALGVALMGLVFYSDASRADEAVRDASTSGDRANDR
jgi:uncharacterized membrane protein